MGGYACPGRGRAGRYVCTRVISLQHFVLASGLMIQTLVVTTAGIPGLSAVSHDHFCDLRGLHVLLVQDLCLHHAASQHLDACVVECPVHRYAGGTRVGYVEPTRSREPCHLPHGDIFRLNAG